LFRRIWLRAECSRSRASRTTAQITEQALPLLIS
jgi:hypothetical protein